MFHDNVGPAPTYINAQSVYTQLERGGDTRIAPAPSYLNASLWEFEATCVTPDSMLVAVRASGNVSTEPRNHRRLRMETQVQFHTSPSD